MTDLIQIPINYETSSRRDIRRARKAHSIKQGGKCWYCDVDSGLGTASQLIVIK